MKKFLLLFCTISLTLLACRKYEDGPSFTLLTKKQRIIKTWNLDIVIKQIGSNRFDVTDTYPGLRLDFTRDSLRVDFTPSGEMLRTTWELSESKEALSWTADREPTTLIDDSILGADEMSYDSLGRFDIQRLTSGQMWLVDKFNNTLRFVPE